MEESSSEEIIAGDRIDVPIEEEFVVINSEDVQMISEPEEHEEVDAQPLIERELESGSPAKIFS